jgi:hypothetical protein
LKEAVPQALWPNLTVSSASSESIQQILDFTDGIGLHASVVCTDNVADNDWILHRLRPRGTSVVLGLGEQGFHFDAINLTFHEIVVKGGLHASVDGGYDKDARSRCRAQGSEPACHRAHRRGGNLPERSAKHDFKGKMVVMIQ